MTDTVTVTTELTDDDVEQVIELARERGVSSTTLLRNAVRTELDRAEELKA